MFKAAIIPLVLILCFGGGFVALTKPFNIRATVVIFGLALAILVFGYSNGFVKVGAALAILGCLALLFSGRLKA